MHARRPLYGQLYVCTEVPAIPHPSCKHTRHAKSAISVLIISPSWRCAMAPSLAVGQCPMVFPGARTAGLGDSDWGKICTLAPQLPAGPHLEQHGNVKNRGFGLVVKLVLCRIACQKYGRYLRPGDTAVSRDMSLRIWHEGIRKTPKFRMQKSAKFSFFLRLPLVNVLPSVKYNFHTPKP